MTREIIFNCIIVIFIIYIIYEIYSYKKRIAEKKLKPIDTFYNEIVPYTTYNYVENSIKITSNNINDTRGIIGFSIHLEPEIDNWKPPLDYEIAKEVSNLPSNLNEITYRTNRIDSINKNQSYSPKGKYHSKNDIENILRNIYFDNKLIQFFNDNLQFYRCYRYNQMENPEKNQLISVIVGKDIETATQKLYLVYEIMDKPVDTNRKQIMKCMEMNSTGSIRYKLYDSQFCSPNEIVRYMENILKGWKHKRQFIEILKPYIQYQIIFLRYISPDSSFLYKDMLYGMDIQMNKFIGIIKYPMLELFKLVQDINLLDEDKLESSKRYLEIDEWFDDNAEFFVYWLGITNKDGEVSFCIYYRKESDKVSKDEDKLKRITIF